MGKKILIKFMGIIFCMAVFSSLSTAKDLEIGQIWAYETREKDQGSTLTILKIEKVKDTIIVHISIDGVNLNTPKSDRVYERIIGHLPIEEKSLHSSLTSLVDKTNELPDFQEGYDMWKEAFDSGEGGFFTISVAMCVEYMEQVLNQ